MRFTSHLLVPALVLVLGGCALGQKGSGESEDFTMPESVSIDLGEPVAHVAQQHVAVAQHREHAHDGRGAVLRRAHVDAVELLQLPRLVVLRDHRLDDILDAVGL